MATDEYISPATALSLALERGIAPRLALGLADIAEHRRDDFVRLMDDPPLSALDEARLLLALHRRAKVEPVSMDSMRWGERGTEWFRTDAVGALQVAEAITGLVVSDHVGVQCVRVESMPGIGYVAMVMSSADNAEDVAVLSERCGRRVEAALMTQIHMIILCEAGGVEVVMDVGAGKKGESNGQ